MSDAIGVAYVLGKINGLTPDEAWETIGSLPLPYHWAEWQALDEALKEKARRRWEEEVTVFSSAQGEVPPDGVPSTEPATV